MINEELNEELSVERLKDMSGGFGTVEGGYVDEFFNAQKGLSGRIGGSCL